ncbi:hypothetical protein SAMN05660420_00466 [Desulfuromusa kysingii]|uniref:Flagellar Assembly Protein A N-terminal region domain-containing protein n=1 Tax=Desulfuromusa kysingii TaxID=37625 RepID=A0A1H3W4E7_9BACT|nr:FapA family protein [Desulfuromusa kysingii]SDZ81926.1 hypothetical protein SAMN05660420_00466 [Desulfuromusa kysingii]
MESTSTQKNVAIGIKLIAEYVTDAYDLTLEAHDHQLECHASITVHDTANSIPPAELISLLKKNAIVESVDLEQVAIFCSEAAQGENPQSVILATGIKPVKGDDGWFELIVSTGDEDTPLPMDEKGRVDFKAVQSFSNVEQDQQIGSIHPPTKGVDGKTITGTPLPAKEGEISPFVAGEGVLINPEGTHVFATKAGRAVLDKNTLSVLDEFLISGDVDLSIGHVNFNGLVVVKGDVLDDFNITATKGVTITGAVGNCQIKSEGPVTIGTMAGQGSGSIHCRGDLKANYLNHVTVECQGNISIVREVRNSILKSTGRIDVAKGLITGGETVALEGIEVKILGARAGVKTYVTSGVYFPEEDRLEYLKTQLKSTGKQVKTIKETLTLLAKNPLKKSRKALREAIELRSDILKKRSAKLDAEQKVFTKELESFARAEHPTANPKINILGAAKEGVVVALGQALTTIDDEISGPTSIIENSRSGGIRLMTYAPLTTLADDMDEEL